MKQRYLSAHNLSIGYKSRSNSSDDLLYSNLNFELFSNELTCLLGANGTGKSTLLKTLNSSLAPLSGDILLFEKNLKSYSEVELSKKLGLVLTEKVNAGGFFVKELVGLGRYPYTGFWGKFTSSDIEITERAMQAVGIIHKADSYVSELSDGEKQKVMIAKALAQECPIILLDEPTAFLDATSRIEIMHLLRRLAKEQNKAILLSTHDIELATSMADRLWLLSEDRGMKCGIPEDIVLSNDINLYLGQDSIQFDIETGSFNAINETHKYVEVQANPILLKWARSFLARQNYSIADSQTPSEKIQSRLSVVAPDKIIYEDLILNKKNEVSSFEELTSLF